MVKRPEMQKNLLDVSARINDLEAIFQEEPEHQKATTPLSNGFEDTFPGEAKTEVLEEERDEGIGVLWGKEKPGKNTGLDWDDAEQPEDGDEKTDDEDTPDDDELFRLVEAKRKAKLGPGDHKATLGKVDIKKANGIYGTYLRANIPCIVKKPDGRGETIVHLIASKSMNPKGRLYQALKGILGHPPEAGYDLRDLEGREVWITIEHHEDEKGNVWENIVSIGGQPLSID